MQFFASAILIAALAAITSAVPLQGQNVAVGTSWSGDNCEGSSYVGQVYISGYQCYDSIPGASIQVSGQCVLSFFCWDEYWLTWNIRGCITTTWSGTNCEGSSSVVPDSNCNAVPFGSWSIDCNN